MDSRSRRTIGKIKVDSAGRLQMELEEAALPARTRRQSQIHSYFSRYMTIAGVLGSFSDILSVGGTVAGLFGWVASGNDLGVPQLPLDQAPLPIRMALFWLFSAGLGWVLGLIVQLLRHHARTVRLMISLLATLVMAGFLTGFGDWLIAPRHPSDLPQQFVLTLLGAMVAMRCTVENLSASRTGVSTAEVEERSLVLLAFAISIAAFLVFIELGAN